MHKDKLRDERSNLRDSIKPLTHTQETNNYMDRSFIFSWKYKMRLTYSYVNGLYIS